MKRRYLYIRKSKRMKTHRIKLLSLILILLIPTFAFSQDTFIWSEGKHKKLGRIDNKGIILDDSNANTFGKRVGRIKDGVIYNDPHGGMPIGRFEKKGNGVYNIYDSAYGGKPVGRWEDGKVYDRGSYGGRVIGLSENKDAVAYFLLMDGGLLEKDFTKRKWNE